MRVDDCVGILLAGGFGRRYAAQAPGVDKLLARLPDGRPVAVAAAQALLAVLPCVYAVVRPESAELARLLASEGCRVLPDEAARQGMGASLAAAASALMREYPLAPSPQAGAVSSDPPGPDRCLVALADMPWVRPGTLLHLALNSRGHLIAAPEFQARRGHPVVFAAALWPELARLSGDTGARELLGLHGVERLAVDDPGILADVDLPTDLRPGI
ncbi:molybdenum hydroxylase accessory protein%2C YgfJ family [Bordetella ansorpii]|uniref:Molybdenum hydroxylase accessory protein, YgfJ family n=1 Tax=Bordetella ansorpii TaxID=288768 RepID=A0A157QYC1_9BORD|nr:NTP transferase domain-containing protein [Bordetella ansorpii]SAI50700.1 molybdenum hydroxylase accessory protein%2C YgfJ family [Bordetella ansorpii]